MKHPAKFSDTFLPIFSKLLAECNVVLDPMAGTGKLALIKNYGFKGKIVCNEIEPEWMDTSEMPVDEWHVGDASKMIWAENDSFDGICTSPTYGNRMADHFKSGVNTPKKWKYITYTHFLGRELNQANTGKMHWGEEYKQKHIEIYTECFRVLKKNGIMIINVSDHIRKGVQIPVSEWHKDVIIEIGFKLKEDILVPTKRMRYGKNHQIRVNGEHILIFTKLEGC